MYKGLAMHMVGKITFVLAGFLMHYFLGKMLSPAMYGIVGIIITIINFNYLFLNNGIRQAISNMIAMGRFNNRDLIRKGMLYETFVLACLFVINFFGAPLIAQILKDPGLTDYIRMSAIIIPFIGFYFASLGVFNGFKLFIIEATIVTIYPLLRLLVIPFVQFVFTDPVIGTEMGFIASAVGIFLISIFYLFRKVDLKKNDKPKVENRVYIRKSIEFLALFSAATVVTNFDTIIIKIVSNNDTTVGYYTGAYQFGSVTYFLMAAFYLVILPIITRLYSENKLKEARICIQDLLTIILAAVLPVAVIVGASSQCVLSLFYKPEYAVGGWALTFLLFGLFCLGMTLVLNMIISATNKQRFSTIIAVLTIGIFISVCFVLTNWFSLSGTGAASLVTCAITMVISGIYVKKIFGNVWSGKHTKIIIINIVLFAAVKLLVNYISIQSLPMLIAIYVALYLLTFGVFRAFKIITPKQVLAALKK